MGEEALQHAGRFATSIDRKAIDECIGAESCASKALSQRWRPASGVSAASAEEKATTCCPRVSHDIMNACVGDAGQVEQPSLDLRRINLAAGDVD